MNNETVASLFNVRSHNPSFFSVKQSVKCEGELLDFCIPVNLHFPPAELVRLIHEQLGEILRYYPDYADVHQQYLAEMTDLSPDTIVPCNGSTEIITRLCQRTQGPVLTSIPTFSRWTDLPLELNLPIHTIERRRENNFRLEVCEVVERAREVDARTVVISNPNNPTGAWFTLDEVKDLVKSLKDIDAVIVDESFIDFSDLESAGQYVSEFPNLVVVKSMGKSLGWHGVRLGYAVASPGSAQELRDGLPFWNINGLAAYILKMVGNFRPEYVASFEKVAADRNYMASQLADVDHLIVYPSKSNFLFVELEDGFPGRELRNRLLVNHGVMVRECSNKLGSSEQFLRLAVQRREAVDVLVHALNEELAQM
jgi:threonine-phosphate decarboxylase